MEWKIRPTLGKKKKYDDDDDDAPLASFPHFLLLEAKENQHLMFLIGTASQHFR